MAFPDSFIEELVERSNIVDVVSNYVQLTRKAPSYDSSLDNMGAVITVFNY